jgi:glycerol-3-phosphate dehydrogenase
MGAMAPSKASRTHKIFEDGNLFSIAGGKLTTFQRMASDMLKHIRPNLPRHPSGRLPTHDGIFPEMSKELGIEMQERLSGILGFSLADFLAEIPSDELKPLGSTPFTLGEIRWAVRHEMVQHLSDLMLRRTRLGLVSAEGGTTLLPQIKTVIQQELGWSDTEWAQEQSNYLRLWHECYSTPQV